MGVISTQGFVFRLVANDVQLDLFDDEDILISFLNEYYIVNPDSIPDVEFY